MPPADSILGVVSMMTAALLAWLSLVALTLTVVALLGGRPLTFAAEAPLSPPLPLTPPADLSAAATDMVRSLQQLVVLGSHAAAAVDGHSGLQAKERWNQIE